MNCVRYDICVHYLWFVFFPGEFLRPRVTGACPVTTDLIMRVKVRTTTTVYISAGQLQQSYAVCRLTNLVVSNEGF